MIKFEHKVEDDVLHIAYTKSIPDCVEKIADIYEGKVKNRIGINFPISVLNKWKGKCFLNDYIDKCKYVVVYKKGDKLTKAHELLHAKYYMDEKYKDDIKRKWQDMDKNSKDRVIKMLKKMGYPGDNEEIIIDEFQAYYYTEKDNFFGKI